MSNTQPPADAVLARSGQPEPGPRSTDEDWNQASDTARPEADDIQIAVATVGLFALCHAATVAAFLILLRRNIGGGILSAGAALLHLVALLGLILVLLEFARRRSAGAPNAAVAIALGGVCGFLLPLGGLFLGSLSLLASAAAAAAGVLLSAKALRGSWMPALPVIVFGVLSGLVLSIISNGEIYAHVLAPEFTLLGWQAADPVFHAAVAQLIANYGLPTTGVDGTPPLFYHVFSHFLVAGLSREAGESALLAYPAAQQVLFIPSLLLGTALAVTYLCRFGRGAALIAPVGVVFVWQLYVWFGAYNSFILSESYAASLTLFSFGLPLALQGPDRGAGLLLRWLVVIGLVGVVSIAAKFTLIFAWMLVIAWGVWRREHQTSPNLAKAALVAAGLGYLLFLYLMFIKIGGIEAVELFSYASIFPRLLLVSVGFGIAGILATLFARNRDSILPSPVFLILFVALLHLPDQFFKDGGGGEYYWFHPADHLAIIVLIAVAIGYLDRLSSNRRWVPSAAASLATVATICVLIKTPLFVYYANTVATTLVAFDRLAELKAPPTMTFVKDVRSHESTRQILTPDLPVPWSDAGLPALGHSIAVIARHLATGVPKGVADAVDQAPLAKAVHSVTQSLLTVHTSRPGLLVGPENEWYWRGHYVCISRNFAFQALTGLALLSGHPDANENCPDVAGYGAASYGDGARSSLLSVADICAAAAERGLSPILRVTGPDHPVEVLCR